MAASIVASAASAAAHVASFFTSPTDPPPPNVDASHADALPASGPTSDDVSPETHASEQLEMARDLPGQHYEEIMATFPGMRYIPAEYVELVVAALAIGASAAYVDRMLRMCAQRDRKPVTWLPRDIRNMARRLRNGRRMRRISLANQHIGIVTHDELHVQQREARRRSTVRGVRVTAMHCRRDGDGVAPGLEQVPRSRQMERSASAERCALRMRRRGAEHGGAQQSVASSADHAAAQAGDARHGARDLAGGGSEPARRHARVAHEHAERRGAGPLAQESGGAASLGGGGPRRRNRLPVQGMRRNQHGDHRWRDCLHDSHHLRALQAPVPLHQPLYAAEAIRLLPEAVGCPELSPAAQRNT